MHAIYQFPVRRGRSRLTWFADPSPAAVHDIPQEYPCRDLSCYGEPIRVLPDSERNDCYDSSLATGVK